MYADIVQKMEELSQALDKHKGKKVYGYLSKKNKDMVDNIVKMVAEDEKIAELYDFGTSFNARTIATIPIRYRKRYRWKQIKNSNPYGTLW